jgi:hypothetical protein
LTRLTLAATAAATGQPVRRLRGWCATGKLDCERDGDTWLIGPDQILRIPELVARRARSIAAGRPAAAIVPVTNATPDLAAEIARRLGIAEAEVAVSTLALDGREYLMAVWKTGADDPTNLAPVVSMVENLGGDVLDGEVSRG